MSESFEIKDKVYILIDSTLYSGTIINKKKVVKGVTEKYYVKEYLVKHDEPYFGQEMYADWYNKELLSHYID